MGNSPDERDIFPTQAMLAKTHAFDGKALNNQKYKQDFQHLIGA